MKAEWPATLPLCDAGKDGFRIALAGGRAQGFKDLTVHCASAIVFLHE